MSSRGELGVRGVRRSVGLGQVGLLEGQQVGPQDRAQEWAEGAKGMIWVRDGLRVGAGVWRVLESQDDLVGRGQSDFLRSGLCKPQAILVLGSSCLWPNHIPGLGAARPPAPFRAPFSDPDQPSVCTSSQGLLVWSDPTLSTLDGPRLPQPRELVKALLRGPPQRRPRSGTEKTTPYIESEGVKPVCTPYVTLGPTCHCYSSVCGLMQHLSVCFPVRLSHCL